MNIKKNQLHNFWEKLVRKIRIITSHKQGLSDNYKPRVSYNLSDRIEEIKAKNYQKIGVYGDSDFYQEVSSQTSLLSESLTWISDTFDDQLQQANHPSFILNKKYDCILVGGLDVKNQYRNLLRLINQGNFYTPILWVAKDFEFAGGNLCIPSSAIDADIYLYNHFYFYFSNSDPLCIELTISDAENIKKISKIIDTKETLRFRLNDIFPEREGATLIQVYTQHPTLSYFRHYRWRFFADVYFKKSFTSLHGTHYFDKPFKIETRINNNLYSSNDNTNYSVEYLFSYPIYDNYENLGLEKTPNNQTQNNEEKNIYWYNPKLTINERKIIINKDNFVDFSLEKGHSGMFVYIGEKYTSQEDYDSVMSNHLITIPLEKNVESQNITENEINYLQVIYDQGFLLTPLAIPILDPNLSLELGISIGETNPFIFDYEFYLFNSEGKKIDRISHKFDKEGFYYTSDILNLFASSFQAQANMILGSPNYSKIPINPRKVRGQPSLVVRHQKSGDKDLTEFQSSWRNLGTKIKQFPHWLNPQKALISGTKLMGRLTRENGFKTGLIIINGSGNLHYNKKANFSIRLYNSQRHEQIYWGIIPAFGCQFFWLDNCFSNLKSFLPENWGIFIIESSDTDLNAHVITVNSDESVSLQHLWGY